MKNVFKLLTVVCLVATMTTFTSCKKSNEDLIVGTWKCTSAVTNPHQDFYDELMVGTVFTFNADKTFSVMVMGQEMKGTYSISDNKLTVTYNPEDTNTMEIKTLDKKKLSLYSKDEGLSDEGDIIEIEVTVNFERQ